MYHRQFISSTADGYELNTERYVRFSLLYYLPFHLVLAYPSRVASKLEHKFDLKYELIFPRKMQLLHVTPK